MQLIAWKSGDSNLLVDPEEIKPFKLISSLNEEAESVYELYGADSDEALQPGSIWKDIVLVPERASILQELHRAITKIENPAL